MEERVRRWVRTNQEAILQCLKSLVAINTENLAPDGNEYDGQMAVAARLQALGCAVDVYEIAGVPGLLDHPQYWPARPCTGRPNVMGIRRGTGGGRSLLLSGHMDTVPVGPDPWTRHPWGGQVDGGKLWGLGAYDMKAGLAAALMAIQGLNDLGIRLRGDLMVESVVDEEFAGCNGTLAARCKYNADLAVVSEPTNLVVCPAHHGGMMLRVTFHGQTGWGFSPEKPVDPVHALGRFITVLNAWGEHRQATVSPPEIYRENPHLPVIVNQVRAGDVSLGFFGDRVPSQAWLCAWIEAYPGMTPDGVLGELQAFYRQARAADPVLARFEPEWLPLRWLDGSQIPAAHPGVQMLARVVGAVQGKPAAVRGAPFACDGHIFNLYSPTPVVLLGPAGGCPHAPDEFVDLETYFQLVEVFMHGAIHWCGLG